MRFIVASLDVLGNISEGWEVNDQHQVGTIDISQEVAEDDQLTLNVLNANGFLENATIDDVYFMADGLDEIVIYDDETDRPVLTLILEH